MALEQREVASGGEGGATVAFAWYDTSANEFVSAERAAEIQAADVRQTIAAAPAFSGTILEAPSYDRPYYTVKDAGGAIGYVAPWQSGQEAGKSWWGPNDAFSRVINPEAGAMVRFLQEDFGIFYAAPPPVQRGIVGDQQGGFLDFVKDTAAAALQGPVFVVGTGYGVSSLAGTLGVQASAAIGGVEGGAVAGLPASAGAGSVGFAPGASLAGIPADLGFDFVPGEPLIPAQASGPLMPPAGMPPAIAESSAQLTEWGLKQISPGVWAQPEIVLQGTNIFSGASSVLERAAGTLGSTLLEAVAKTGAGAAAGRIVQSFLPGMGSATRAGEAIPIQAGAGFPLGAILVLAALGAVAYKAIHK